MVYQFAMPPLLLYTLNRGNSNYLQDWASSLGDPMPGCTFLNFTASHDGIGLRALEGLLSPNETEDLINSMRSFGGFISMKANPDGVDTPYEINISLFDAMQGTRRGPDQWQVERFILSQVMMMSFQGIPAIYIHSILATPNDLHAVELTGRTRSINRKRWQSEELREALDNVSTPQSMVFNQMKQLISVRRRFGGFHPDSPQKIVRTDSGLFVLYRTDLKTGKRLLCIFNVTATVQPVEFLEDEELYNLRWHDLVEGKPLDIELHGLRLSPYRFLWLAED